MRIPGSSLPQICTMASWILKSEPSEYSIDMLMAKGVGTWDGVRNHQAKNFLAEMKIGDIAYFYHSSCATPGIVGKMSVCKEAYPDSTAVDRSSKYYDEKAAAKGGVNKWLSVDMQFVCKYETPLLLPAIRQLPLGECRLTAKGNRLSVIPLTVEQAIILETELARSNNHAQLLGEGKR